MATISTSPFFAVVLAADRTSADPVAHAAGAACKALAPVAGRPMLLRVLDALADAEEVKRCIICGPSVEILDGVPELRDRIASGAIGWLPHQATPSTSALAALHSLPEDAPVLLTTADHALLSAAVVDYFCRQARASGCDVVAGLASHALTVARYPGMRRTKTRFRDGPYCGCNLYAFLTPESRSAADFWRRVEHQRKSPLKMIAELGWLTALCYVLGTLSLKGALRLISKRMGIQAGAVILPYPEAAVDVDSVDDWRFAQDIASRTGA
ncbi:MAG: nucleotidyltransferase family protein [Desulfobacterales bacterium]